MLGGEDRSNYIALPGEGPGQLYLEDEDGPFDSRKPSAREFHTAYFTQARLTLIHSRKSPVPLGVYRRNMLFSPLDGTLPHGFIPNPPRTEILPNCGPPTANQHLLEH